MKTVPTFLIHTFLHSVIHSPTLQTQSTLCVPDQCASAQLQHPGWLTVEVGRELRPPSPAALPHPGGPSLSPVSCLPPLSGLWWLGGAGRLKLRGHHITTAARGVMLTPGSPPPPRTQHRSDRSCDSALFHIALPGGNTMLAA